MPARHDRGFTLVEMVIAISLTGLVAVLMTLVSGRHMEAYLDAQRRAGLASDAGYALGRLGRELRSARPDSVVVSESSLGFITHRSPEGVRYVCEAGTLASGKEVVLEKVQSCRFHLRPAGKGSQPIVTVWLSMGEQGEAVALLDQFAIASGP